MPAKNEAMQALQDLLGRPFNLRAHAWGSAERKAMIVGVESLRRQALLAGAEAMEAKCLEGLMHLRGISASDRLRLAFLWSHQPEPPESFAAASLYAEYVSSSKQSGRPFEGYENVSRILNRICAKKPRWLRLIELQGEMRQITHS